MTSIAYSRILQGFLLLYSVIHLEASHVIYKRIQTNVQSLSPPHNQPYRTAYHFQPPKNWINDPNGPMFFSGTYHLFYQYNPKGVFWEEGIVWGHAISKNLINWNHEKIAISPSIPSDSSGCWSGSTTILPGQKPAILYTGVDPQGKQVQNLAVPKNLSEPNLSDWIKVPENPLIVPTPQNKINETKFRDPTTAWLLSDGFWRIVIGSKVGNDGVAYLFKSNDFIHWTKADEPLHHAEGIGMWECPDFYPVYLNKHEGADTSSIGSDLKHVLKGSLDDTKHDYYTLGYYNVSNDIYVPDKGMIEGDSGLRYDYGIFYASKTFFDTDKKRRILWGWVNESDMVQDDMKKGWAGVQALPRTILLDKSGKQLTQWPVEEVEMLREGQVVLPKQILEGRSLVQVPGVTAAQADVEISFKVQDLEGTEMFDPTWTNPQQLCNKKGANVQGHVGPFGLLALVSANMEEQTPIFFRIFKRNNDSFVVLMCTDHSRSSLSPTNDKVGYGTFVEMDPKREEVSLRVLIDHSIIESYGANGKSCITSRVYPTLAIDDNAHLYAFNNGTKSVQITNLHAWSMNKAVIH